MFKDLLWARLCWAGQDVGDGVSHGWYLYSGQLFQMKPTCCVHREESGWWHIQPSLVTKPMIMRASDPMQGSSLPHLLSFQSSISWTPFTHAACSTVTPNSYSQCLLRRAGATDRAKCKNCSHPVSWVTICPFCSFRVIVVDYSLDLGKTYSKRFLKVTSKDCVSDRVGGVQPPSRYV